MSDPAIPVSSSPQHPRQARLPELVFVYGTLKRGERNHPAMVGAGLEREGGAHLRGWRLLEVRAAGVRAYPYPGLRPGPGLVVGELYRQAEQEGQQRDARDALAVLDHLEREGHEYRRLAWWARSGGQRVRVWVYVLTSDQVAARSGARTLPGVCFPRPHRRVIGRVFPAVV